MTRQIEIITGARLHFGLLAHAPLTGPEFGGAGLMIDSPGFHLIARPGECDAIDAGEPYRERIARYLACFRENCRHLKIPPCRLQLLRSVPVHCGLGSGTQLGMAVSRAVSLLAGDDERDSAVLARRVGRGARSAIGIHGFTSGGFLIDAGKAGTADIAPLASRVEFPSDWRVLLITPTGDAGLSGTCEERAFSRLPGMPAETTARLREIAARRLLPAVREKDLVAAGAALHDFGRLVGDYFAPVQGGVYANPLMRQLAETLRERGIHGVGQTSWGPTLFALLEDETRAEQLAAELAGESTWNACRFHVAGPLNRGARVTVDETRN